MLLNDAEIRRRCLAPLYADKPLLDPFSEGVQDGGVVSYGLSHAGYDLRLGPTLFVFKNSYNEVIDPKRFKDEEYRKRVFDLVAPGVHVYRHGSSGIHASGDSSSWVPNGYIVPPHSYVLGVSLERIHIHPDVKGRCVGKSTYARCGLVVNTTPAEPGWVGHLTIEIANTSPCPVLIFAGEGIAQMEFETLTQRVEADYADKGGKYQDQPCVPVPAKVKE